MLVALAASGVGLLALPGLLRPVGRRLRPAEWARLSLVCIGAGAAVVELAAVLYGLPAVATASGVPSLEVLCHRALGPLAPGGAVAGWAAIAVAVAVPAAGALGWSRARRTVRSARIERGLGHHEPYGGHELVVLPSERPLAVSVPVPPRQPGRHQIVVSDGLVELLTPEQLDAVLRHEAAHLRHGHRRHLAVAAAVDRAFAWFPPAAASTATLRIALERTADEHAAATGDRGTVRAALLAVTARMLAGPALAAFSAAETIGERLDALDDGAPHPPAGPHLLLYVPGAVLGAVAVAIALCLGTNAGGLLALAGHCFH